jgi:hypothetical protein
MWATTMCDNRLLVSIECNGSSLKCLSYKAEWLLTHSEHLARVHRQISGCDPLGMKKARVK